MIRPLSATVPSAALLVMICIQCAATNVVITSISANGTIAWTNDVTNVTYQVQWGSRLDGNWQGSWASLEQIQGGTNTTFRTNVPMFYRVVIPGEDLSGTWMLQLGTNAPQPMTIFQSGNSFTGALDTVGLVVGIISGDRVGLSFSALIEGFDFGNVLLGTVVSSNRMEGDLVLQNPFSPPPLILDTWSADKQ